MDYQHHSASDLWIGFSRFEVPEVVTDYAGKVAAHVLLLLYQRASGKSIYSSSERDLSFVVSEDWLAKKTGLTTRSIQLAFAQLESDGRIRKRRRTYPDGTVRTSVVLTLLDSSGSPLQTTPYEYGVCRKNDLPFITFTKRSLDAINKMKLPSAKAVYIAALALVHRNKKEGGISVDRKEWQQLSGLGESKYAFKSGLAYLKAEKLVTYRKQMLTVNDPRTGEPADRSDNPKPRIDHGPGTNWKDGNLDDVPAEDFQRFVEAMLGRKFEVGEDGWTLRSECPFCNYKKRFRMNFTWSQFICDCGKRGRLVPLVSEVKGIPQSEVITLLRESMKPREAISI
jgi:hypothetical protein